MIIFIAAALSINVVLTAILFNWVRTSHLMRQVEFLRLLAAAYRTTGNKRTADNILTEARRFEEKHK